MTLIIILAKENAEILSGRQSTISDFENRKGEVDASTLASLAHILNKPLGYCYPPSLYQEIKQEDLSPLENELLISFHKIVDESLQKAVINQVKVIGDFDPKELIINLAPEIAARISNKDNLLYIQKSQSNKRHKE